MGEPSGPPDQSCCPCGPTAQTTQQQRIATGADLQWPGGITPQAMERFDELKRRVAYQGQLLGPVIQAIGGQIIADLEYHDRLLNPVLRALTGPIQRRVRAQSKALQAASDMLTSAIWQRIQEQGTRLTQIQQALLTGEYAPTPQPVASPMPAGELPSEVQPGEAEVPVEEPGPAIGGQGRSLSLGMSGSGISERTTPLPALQEQEHCECPSPPTSPGGCQQWDICKDGQAWWWIAWWWRTWWPKIWEWMQRQQPGSISINQGDTRIVLPPTPEQQLTAMQQAQSNQPNVTPQQYDGSLRLTITTGLPWDDPYAGDDLVEDNR